MPASTASSEENLDPGLARYKELAAHRAIENLLRSHI
jgi:hypothetical protein